MKDILVAKSKLLEAIKLNRANHVTEHKGALEAYFHKAAELFAQHRELALASKDFPNHLPLDRPFNHTDDYDEIIAMLEMTEEQNITLTREDFKRYVLDDWEWSRIFKSVNTAYLKP